MTIITKAEWTISGAKASQDYQKPQGSTLDLSSPVTHTWGGAAVAFDTMNFYWDATTGDHTISVTVTYVGGSTGTATRTVTVGKPTVNSSAVIYPGAVASPGGVNNVVNGQYGFTNTGITYGASVSFPADSRGGSFAIIQKISGDYTYVNRNTATNTTSTHSLHTGVVLDDAPGSTPGIFLGNMTVSVGAGATNTSSFVPDQAYTAYHIGTNEVCLEFSSTVTLQDFLVAKEDNGIWVQLAKSDPYSYSGDMEWNFGTSQFDVQSLSPTNGSSVTMTNELGFVTWTGYYTDAADFSKFSPPFP